MNYTVATTCDSFEPISIAHPIMKNTCAIFVVVALMTANANLVPMQNMKREKPGCISTDFELDSSYNRSITLSWDGISDMRIKLEQSIARISEIEALEDNWNGNGAVAFTPAIIQRVKELVSGLAIQPTILPTGRASIQLEYENDSEDYLEFELFESGRLKMFSYMKDGQSETKDIPESSVNEVVCKFYGRII